ncbi:MAG: hypothetical protein Q9197_005740 [Variospora fuerteventurae]
MVSVSQKIARIEAGLAPFEDLGQGVQDALQQLFGDDLTARDLMMVEGIIRDFSRLLLGEYERHRVKGDDHLQGNEKQVINSDGWSQEKEVAVQHKKHDAEGKLVILAIKQSKESD